MLLGLLGLQKKPNLVIRVYRTPLARGTPQDDKCPLPTSAHVTDAGFDIRTAVDVTVEPGQMAQVPTGLVFDMPVEVVDIGGKPHVLDLEFVNRTGNGGKGLIAAAVVVDNGYRSKRGEVKALELRVRNVGTDTLHFKRGDALVQGLFRYVVKPTLVEVEESHITWDTDRGAKRFGDTGR